jgi:hypothetical protein
LLVCQWRFVAIFDNALPQRIEKLYSFREDKPFAASMRFVFMIGV